MAWDVVIAGGGFVGIAAAAALARSGRRVVVLEAHAAANPRFRGELIHPHGAGVLAELGLHDVLAQRGAIPVSGFAVTAAATTQAIMLPYRAARAAPAGLAMDHRAMLASLSQAVAARPGVELRRGRPVCRLVRGQRRVTGVELDGGEQVAAELTIVADGRHSRLRSQLGIPTTSRLLSFTAAVPLEVDVPYARWGHVFIGPLGPILVYSIGHARARMCIDLPIGTAKRRAAIASLLREVCAPALPEPLRSALRLATERPGIELCANHAVHAQHSVVPGAALVGDAGGCWHPITATGLTSGLNDARLLADELARGGAIDVALAGYQRARYSYVRVREMFANTLYEVLRGSGWGERSIRTGVMRYLRRSERARTTSLALMSGQESGLASFLCEFARVMSQAAAGVLAYDHDHGHGHGHGVPPAPPYRTVALARLALASVAQVKRNILPAYRHAAG